MKYLSIILITVLFSCKPAEKTSKTNNVQSVSNKIEFTLIKEGTNSGFITKKEQVITNPTDFENEWNIALANYLERNPVPNFDFNNNQIILITMGEQTSGGHTIRTDSVTFTESTITLNATASKPGNDCMTTSVMTQPFQIINIPKSNKKIEFNITEHTYNCGK